MLFRSQKTALPKKTSYILLFDTTSQRATLEPLDSTYTFNIATKNHTDISSSYDKIYPRKPKDEPATATAASTTAGNDTPAGTAADDLFDESSAASYKLNPDDGDEPDADNPYDFRHFLKAAAAKEKRGAEDSEYGSPDSPDMRTPTYSSAITTPSLPARKIGRASCRERVF